MAEYDSGASTPKKRYRYTENSFAPVGYSEGGRDYTVHNDYLDTPKALTDTSGNVVWSTVLSPYGNTVENTDPDSDGQEIAFNLRLPGQYHDRETGLYYNWNRTYDPESGRYIQSDPMGLTDGANIYLYAHSNPVNLLDPSGLWSFSLDLYAGVGGGVTIGRNRSTSEWFGGGRIGIGVGGGATVNVLDDGPTARSLRRSPYADVSQCIAPGSSGTSVGTYAGIGASVGPYDISYGAQGGGISTAAVHPTLRDHLLILA